MYWLQQTVDLLQCKTIWVWLFPLSSLCCVPAWRVIVLIGNHLYHNNWVLCQSRIKRSYFLLRWNIWNTCGWCKRGVDPYILLAQTVGLSTCHHSVLHICQYLMSSCVQMHIGAHPDRENKRSNGRNYAFLLHALSISNPSVSSFDADWHPHIQTQITHHSKGCNFNPTFKTLH